MAPKFHCAEKSVRCVLQMQIPRPQDPDGSSDSDSESEEEAGILQFTGPQELQMLVVYKAHCENLFYNQSLVLEASFSRCHL